MMKSSFEDNFETVMVRGSLVSQSAVSVLKNSKSSSNNNLPLNHPSTHNLFNGNCSRTMVGKFNKKSMVVKNSKAAHHKVNETSSFLTDWSEFLMH